MSTNPTGTPIEPDQGDFTSAPVRPSNIRPGDFITVISRTVSQPAIPSIPDDQNDGFTSRVMRKREQRLQALRAFTNSGGSVTPTADGGATFTYPNQGLPFVVLAVALPFIYIRQIPGVKYPLTGDNNFQIVNITTDEVRILPSTYAHAIIEDHTSDPEHLPPEILNLSDPQDDYLPEPPLH